MMFIDAGATVAPCTQVSEYKTTKICIVKRTLSLAQVVALHDRVAMTTYVKNDCV